jgi:hypothetical protein
MMNYKIKDNLLGGCLLLFTLLLTACDLETSGNGKLDGYWHLEQIDSISTGSVNNLSQKRLFWAFQAKLLEFTDKDNVNATYLVRFSHSADSLILSEPYRFDRENGDEVLTDAAVLKPYGMNALKETFKIEKLSSSKMILSNSSYRLYFTKF